MVQPKSIITKLFVTVISYAPNGLFLNRPYDHHVMFVNILISILYFAIHVTRLTLNPNVFITRFHFEAHLASNLTGGRFIYWLTSHCITRPTVWIAIFRWAWTSGTSNLLISLNCTFWGKGNLMVKRCFQIDAKSLALISNQILNWRISANQRAVLKAPIWKRA